MCHLPESTQVYNSRHVCHISIYFELFFLRKVRRPYSYLVREKIKLTKLSTKGKMRRRVAKKIVKEFSDALHYATEPSCVSNLHFTYACV